MGRAPCCEKVGLKRGRWTDEEDGKLRKYIEENGEGSWRSLPKNAGLLRCGKSCRLRWINYLRTDLKRGSISAQEEEIIINLHATMGNRWSLIAAHLPGRTDNEIKNYWNSHLSRKIDSYRRPNPNFIPPPPSKPKKKIKNKQPPPPPENNNSKEEEEEEEEEELSAAGGAAVLMPATPTPERETTGRVVTKSSSKPEEERSGTEERESRSTSVLMQQGGCDDHHLHLHGTINTPIVQDFSGLWGLEDISEFGTNGGQKTCSGLDNSSDWTSSSQIHEDDSTFSWFWDDGDDNWNLDDREIDDAMLSWLLS